MSIGKVNPKQPEVTLTDAAIDHIKKYLKENSHAVGLRFTTKKTGCSGYSYVSELVETVVSSDIETLSNCDVPLYMNENSIPLLNNMTIDLVAKDLGQKQLIYHNPNEDARCGCGESFSAKKV